MAGFLDLFIGVPQSKYAGLAILLSLAAVGLAVLLGKEKVPITQKLVVVGLLFLLSLPAMLVTLFQLTCMVTGSGIKNAFWWCSGYAWLVSGLIILYSILLVVMVVLSFGADQESKEIEKFYSRREKFQGAAKEYFEGEMTEEEAKKVVADATASAPTPAVTMPVPQPVPNMPTPQPGVPTTGVVMPPEMGSSVVNNTVPPVPINGGMPPTEVSALEPETFANCGAPYN